MKKRQKFALGFALLAVIGLVASMSIVSAYRGDQAVQGPYVDEEQHALMTQAFDDLDYAAWRDLMETKGARGRVLEMINEENFATFVEAHNAALAGDHELAAQLRAQLNLNNGEGPRDGTGFRSGEGRGEGRGAHAGQGNCYAQ